MTTFVLLLASASSVLFAVSSPRRVMKSQGNGGVAPFDSHFGDPDSILQTFDLALDAKLPILAPQLRRDAVILFPWFL